MSLADLSPQVRACYEHCRELPDGRVLALNRFLFTWGLLIDLDEFGYGDRYCFNSFAAAKAAMDAYDGVTEPEGWHRHPSSGRRREAGKEWVNP